MTNRTAPAILPCCCGLMKAARMLVFEIARRIEQISVVGNYLGIVSYGRRESARRWLDLEHSDADTSKSRSVRRRLAVQDPQDLTYR